MRVKAPYKVGDPVSHATDDASKGVIIFDNKDNMNSTISVHWEFPPKDKSLCRNKDRGEYKLEELIIKRI